MQALARNQIAIEIGIAIGIDFLISISIAIPIAFSILCTSIREDNKCLCWKTPIIAVILIFQIARSY